MAHNAKRPRWLYCPFCIKCGLVYLKNEATRKAIRSRCMADLTDEEYLKLVRKR